MSGNLEAMMEFADKLPSLPTAVVQALQLLRDENSQNERIAQALSMDQALVAQVLKMANSPFYGLSRRVATVEQAILVLGRKAVRSLVVAAASQDYLSRPQAGYMLRRGELWRHSIAAATGAGLIAPRVGYKPAEEAFVAGLLHDIGKVVLSAYLAEQTDELMERLGNAGDTSFDVIEREMASVDSAMLGGMIVEHWQLPAHLARAIANQHHPREAKDDWKLATVVHLANALAMVIGEGVGVDGLQYPLDERAVMEVGLDAEALEEITSELIDKVTDPELA